MGEMPHFQPIDTDLLEKNSIPVLEDAYGRIQTRMHELEVSDPSSPTIPHLLEELRALGREISRLRIRHGEPQVSPVEHPSCLLFG